MSSCFETTAYSEFEENEMALKVVTDKELKRREALEEQYARYLHEVADDIFDTAYHVKDWTWPQLARAAGVCCSTVNRLGKRETRYPRHMTIWKLAKAVGLKYEMIYPPTYMSRLPKKSIKLKRAG